MAEKQSPGERGARLLRRTGDTLKTATGALIGKNVEQQVAEYREVYTQVLLGVHGDLEQQSRKVDDHDKEIEALKHQVADAALQWTRASTNDKDVEALKRKIASMSVTRTLAIAGFALALLAFGVALWTAL